MQRVPQDSHCGVAEDKNQTQNVINKKRFTLTEEHLLLLENCFINWQDDETGAPEINPKRPYGSTRVACDIHKLLTNEDKADDEMSDIEVDRCLELHRETDTALEIVLQTRSFKPGEYTRNTNSLRPGDKKWRLVIDPAG